ncbi:MAG TPA: hypothetical protein VK157_06285 [Phycisphaerales bacterium]|nr:hypothetical protein [Phycisphaerales bacterium]
MGSTHRSVQLGGGIVWRGVFIFAFMEYVAHRSFDVEELLEFNKMASTYESVRVWMLEDYGVVEWKAIHKVLTDLYVILRDAPDGTRIMKAPFSSTLYVLEKSRSAMLQELSGLLALIERRIEQLQSM